MVALKLWEFYIKLDILKSVVAVYWGLLNSSEISKPSCESQYASNDYINTAKQLGMILSYSKKRLYFWQRSNEIFHASLKKEELYLHHYTSFEEAKLKLFEYIEGFYNRNCIHPVIDFLTPIAYENMLLKC